MKFCIWVKYTEIEGDESLMGGMEEEWYMGKILVGKW
jgi:hypothetical protein